VRFIKISISIKNISLALVLLTPITFADAVDFNLNELKVQNRLLCKSTLLKKQNVNYAISFKGEVLSQRLQTDFSKDTLFVGTHFIVNRDPISFSKDKLLSPEGIAKISDSKISSFKLDEKQDFQATFYSSKKLPFFNTLDCANRVGVYDWNEFYDSEIFRPFLQALEEDDCLESDLPFKVTHQEVFSCNNHFKRSEIITLYFSLGEEMKKTRILTYSFSEMKSYPSFLERKVIEREIKQNLKKAPLIIENL
jgi:hypothetical protein